MEIIAIGNQKGGVGKTTTTVNLATAMALKGYKVALLDIDSQGNATSGMGLNKNEFEFTIADVFLGSKTIKEVLVGTEIENLFVAPANINLISAETRQNVSRGTSSEQTNHFILKSALEDLRDYFDYVFLDCPPSLGFLTFNALVAANQIIVTLQCEYYALEGISSLVETIDFVKSNLNPELELGGILPTMYDGRTNLSKQVCENARDFFKDKVFNTVIPRNIKISESPSFGKPIIIYDPNSAGALSYLSACDELEERVLKAQELNNKQVGNF